MIYDVEITREDGLETKVEAYLSLVAVGHQGTATPAVRPYPGEVARHVVTVNGPHQLSHLLVRGEHDDSCQTPSSAMSPPPPPTGWRSTPSLHLSIALLLPLFPLSFPHSLSLCMTPPSPPPIRPAAPPPPPSLGDPWRASPIDWSQGQRAPVTSVDSRFLWSAQVANIPLPARYQRLLHISSILLLIHLPFCRLPLLDVSPSRCIACHVFNSLKNSSLSRITISLQSVTLKAGDPCRSNIDGRVRWPISTNCCTSH